MACYELRAAACSYYASRIESSMMFIDLDCIVISAVSGLFSARAAMLALY